jgi:hypothetical protein
VQVEINADLGLRNFPPPLGEGRVGAASRHVRYYMRGEGSGKGPHQRGVAVGG